MKLDALYIAFSQASYRNVKSSFFIQLHVVCLTFEILFMTILHFFNI